MDTQRPRVGRVCPGLRGDARLSSTASKREPCRLSRHKNIQHTVRYTELSVTGSVQGFLAVLACIKRSRASRILRSSRLWRKEIIARTP